MTNMLLQFLFILASIFFVFLFISLGKAILVCSSPHNNILTLNTDHHLGWYMVWKFFLCRFRLVRELFNLNSQPPSPAVESHHHHQDGGHRRSGGRSSVAKEANINTTTNNTNTTTITQRRGTTARKSS